MKSCLFNLALLLMAIPAAVGFRFLQTDQDASPTAADAAIRKTLDDQVEQWNRGNIPGFMDSYVRDETLRFSSGDSVRRGWEQTLQRYQTAYASKEAMGVLRFSDLEILQISSNYAEVFGKYHLTRDKSLGNASGLFTLLMRRDGDRWLILHDHTSAAPNE